MRPSYTLLCEINNGHLLPRDRERSPSRRSIAEYRRSQLHLIQQNPSDPAVTPTRHTNVQVQCVLGRSQRDLCDKKLSS